jgi:hypothetical protein
MLSPSRTRVIFFVKWDLNYNLLAHSNTGTCKWQQWRAKPTGPLARLFEKRGPVVCAVATGRCSIKLTICTLLHNHMKSEHDISISFSCAVFSVASYGCQHHSTGE